MQSFPPISTADTEAIQYFRVTPAAAESTQLVPGDIVARVVNAGDISVIALRAGNTLAPVAGNDATALLAALVSAGDLVALADAA